MSDGTPPGEEQDGLGKVHWEPLNDIKAAALLSHETTDGDDDLIIRPKSLAASPHHRNLSTSVYDFDQDAYEAARDHHHHHHRPSYSRSASMDTPAIIEAPWNGGLPAASSHSGSNSNKATASTTGGSTKSSKKSKDAPLIPAAQQSGEADSDDRIRLGICAMDKKARSKPMAEILSRLDEKDFQVVFFGDDMILNRPVEEWPICDVVVAFFSKGYPLPKAKEYVALRKPFILNDLEMQEVSD